MERGTLALRGTIGPPLAGTALTATMVTAIRKVHAGHGPWAAGGGYEYNIVIIAALMVLTESGPGRLSVDAALLPRMKGSTLGAAAARRRRRRLVATSDLLNDPDQQAAAATAEDLPAEPGESRFSREQAAEPAAANR